MNKHKAILIALIVFIILRIPSLSEPRWYGDEGVYAGVTYAIEQGKTLYVDVWDNKPPLIYYLYSLGNPEDRITTIRVLNIIAGAISILGIYQLGILFKLKKYGQYALLATSVFLLGTPIIEGNIANGENFFIPFLIWGMVLGLEKKKDSLLISGILFAMAFLVKLHPIFDFIGFVTFLVLVSKKSLVKSILDIRYIFYGFAVPIIMVLAMWVLQGNMYEGIETTITYNFLFSEDFGSGQFSFGVRFTALLLLMAGVYYTLLRKKISRVWFFIITILLFEYFGVLLSGRRFMHYFIQIVPSVSLFVGFIAAYLMSKKSTFITISTVLMVLIVYLSGMSIFFLGGEKLVSTEPITYYKKYFEYKRNPNVKFFLHGSDLVFDELQRDLYKYGISSIYIYTDNAWVYDKLRIVPVARYVVAYHQLLFPGGEFLLKHDLNRVQPKLIVVDKSATFTNTFLHFLRTHYVYDSESDFYEFYIRS